MSTTNDFNRSVPLVLATLILLLAGTVTADPQEDAAQLRSMEQIQTRLQERLEQDPDCGEAVREQVRNNFRACLALGLEPEDMKALFLHGNEDGAFHAASMLQIQNRFLAAGQAGLPLDGMINKVREANLKGVPVQALERVMTRMEQHLHGADRAIDKVIADSAVKVSDGQRDALVTEMARNMWRGLNEGDCDQLRERARARLRDGSCTPEDLNAAASAAAQTIESGMERSRAMNMFGEALEQGFNADGLRRIRLMLMTGHDENEEMVKDLEACLGDGQGPAYVYRHMIQAGWGGPDASPGGDGTGGGGPGQGNHGGSDDDNGQNSNGNNGSGNGTGGGTD